MKSFLYKISILLVILLLSRINVYSENDIYSQRDSLRKLLESAEGDAKLRVYNRLIGTYSADNDTMFILFDELEEEAKKQDNIKTRAMLRVNKLIHFLNAKNYEEIFQRAPEYLDFIEKTELWLYYYYTYGYYVKAYLYSGDQDKAIALANEMYEYAKQKEDNEGLALACDIMALIYKGQERHDEHEKYVRRFLELSKGNDRLLSTSTTAWFELSQSLLAQKRFDEVFEILPKYEQANREFDNYVGNPVISSWVNYWCVCAKLNLLTGNYDEAETYCEKIEDSGYTSKTASLTVNKTRARILIEKKQYEKALEEINKSFDINDPYTPSGIEDHIVKLRILMYLGRGDEAYDLYKVITHHSDSIRNLEFAKQVDELNTQYEVDKLTTEKEIHRQRWIIGVIASVLLLIALIIYIIYSRRLRQRNISLYQQIQELTRKEKEVESCLLSKSPEDLSKEMQLFRQVRECMKEEKLFTDPELNRKKLADHIGTNESYLATAIKQGSGETFSDYLSNLRLQYALDLLNNSPEMTFDALAIDSGHGSYSQFFRSFTKKYGISPSEYRKLSLKKSL